MKAYLRWVNDEALPLWASAGFDPRHERFHERLDQAARPLDVPHRAMVQARQIFVYAHAATTGLFPEGGRLAERAMASLRRDFEQSNGRQTRYVFSIDPQSRQPLSDVRDAYAHAFILFAIAELHAMNGDPALLSLADAVIAFVDAEMADTAHGGLHDALPLSAAAAKRQNPQMHLLEAYLALDHAAPGRGYLQRATELVRLFRERLFSAEHGVLIEHFAHDWAEHPDEAMCRRFEPGHHFEWIWLLARYEARTGEPHVDYRGWLHDAAMGHGIARNGLIHDELDCHRRVTKPSYRLWPHTEAIKAAGVAHAAGDQDAQSFADAMAGGLMTHFLGAPFAGGWVDHIGPDLVPLVDYVPASSLYHLVLAASEARRVFGADALAVSPS